MVTHFYKIYPIGMEDNECYHFLLTDYLVYDQESWEINDLYDDFGQEAVDDIVRAKYLTSTRDGYVQLSFAGKNDGTVPQKILEFCQKEIYTVKELRHKFPKISRCNPKTMKNYLTFLMNFQKICKLDDPATSITCIAVEGSEEIEEAIDRLFSHTDRLETSHLMNVEEGAKDLKRLLDIGPKT